MSGRKRSGARLGGCATLVAASLLLASCAEKKATQATPPPPVVTVAAPIVRDFTEYSEFTGRAEPADAVELRARVSGFVKEVNFDDGSFVKEGDLLFTIDPAPYEAIVRQREAALERAKSAEALALANVERSKPLIDQGVISAQEFDVLAAEKEQATASVASATADLEAARLDLSYTKITAPFAGRIGDAKVSVGALVAPGTGGAGTLLAQMVSVEPMYVTFDLDEGTMIRTRDASPERGRRALRELNIPVEAALGASGSFDLKGMLDFGDVGVNPDTGTIRVRAVFDNKDRALAPGLFVRLRVAMNVAPQATLVPSRAIGTDQDRRFVYVLDDKKTVQYRPVQVGTERGGLTLIREGLSAGDTVVIDGILKLRPGVVPDAKPADMSAYAAAGGGEQAGT